MSDDIDDAALASAALLFVDPRKGLDCVGKDECIGACEFFSVYPETVGRMVSLGLLRGVGTAVEAEAVRAASAAASPLSTAAGASGLTRRFAPMAGLVGLRNGDSKLVSRRLFVPDVEALGLAFRDTTARTWRGCLLSWPHFLAALEHLRAASVVARCAEAGGLVAPGAPHL